MSLDSKFVIIPGAQKAGTTTLHKLITQHSKIAPLTRESGKPIKEPNFFSMEPSCVDENIGWYRSLTSSKPVLQVDASTHYLVSPKTPDLIKKYLDGDVKVVVTVRDPIERSISGFFQQKKKTPPTDQRDLNKIVEKLWGIESERIYDTENVHIKQAVKNGKVNDYLESRLSSNRPFKVNHQDNLMPFKYIQNSIYSKYIGRYKEFNVKVVCFEEMVEEPQKVMSSVFEFLGLSTENVSITHSNPTRVPDKKKRIYTRVSRALRRNRFISSVLELKFIEKIKQRVRPSWMNSEEARGNMISTESREMLRELLAPEYRYWSGRSEDIVQYWDQEKTSV
ncbi:sulfotransferase family protein [Salinibacter ruber]|uniref:sulfotransferase family protein n=1 Tax=Salinibacter ruber TaxID=146919 RepID=UPI002167B43D|nr:sulfotransferase domain-containing protein [Salinibacter ruber]MCS4142544.1 hypothetical protein [Salinibacter ruber]